MDYHDYIGDDMGEDEVRELKFEAGASKRDYRAWLAEQDEQTRAEERLFRSDGL